MIFWSFSDERPDAVGGAETPDGVDPELEEQFEDDDSEVSDLMLKLLPWGVSVLLHAGMILLAVFVVWSVQQVIEDEKIIVPDTNLVDNPSLQTSMSRVTSTTTSSSSAQRRSLSQRPSGVSAAAVSAASSSTSLGNIGLGGAAGGGGQGAFASGVAAGNAFGVSFFGVKGGNVRAVVYVIDASGSLIGTFPFIIDELKQTINRLSDKQRFSVIFYQGEDPIEARPAGMTSATQANKNIAIEWISSGSGNILPRGLSSPVKAISMALRYKPDMIYLLSDNITGKGRYEVDQRMLLEDIREANKSNTIISTIQFIWEDPLTKYKDRKGNSLLGTMELIASQNNGEQAFRSAQYLGFSGTDDDLFD